jgi:hypothetical protein
MLIVVIHVHNHEQSDIPPASSAAAPAGADRPAPVAPVCTYARPGRRRLPAHAAGAHRVLAGEPFGDVVRQIVQEIIQSDPAAGRCDPRHLNASVRKGIKRAIVALTTPA